MKKKLVVGNIYWIFTGTMQPIKRVLTKIVNDGNTAIFGAIPRKVTSVYFSKEEALKKNKY